ncbi:MAG: tetratricopeptide repeat protein [Desulfitobacteriaceae bacterium]
MHIGHNEDDIDHQDLALRRFGAGLMKERNGLWDEALAEYLEACKLDPDLLIAQEKLASLQVRLKQP